MHKPSIRHLLSIADLSRADVDAILSTSIELKRELKQAQSVRSKPAPRLPGDVLAMIFEKPSLRTRATFETGIVQLGGHAINMSNAEIGLGKREAVKDVARALGRWVQLIMARVYKQETVEELAAHAGVPVISGLSDSEHPCQILADYMTILEHRGTFEDFHLAWIGDGFNVTSSLMLMSAVLNTRLTMAIPAGEGNSRRYDPPAWVWEKARALNPNADQLLKIVRSPQEAVEGVDAVYTDVFTSMGQEAESAQRMKDFAGFQVNAELLADAPDNVMVMHDLPAHRGEEITDDVMDDHIPGVRNVIFDQAENRLHAQKGVMCFLRGVTA